MKIAVFSTKNWVLESLEAANSLHSHTLSFLEPRLGAATAKLADGHDAVCAFVNDDLSAPVLDVLKECGIRLVAMRCAGFNNVDVRHANTIGMQVVRVPAYSPFAVAEHTLGMILTLNRRLHRSYSRVRDGNFSLDGLLGFDIHDKTVGIIGTGKIGQVFANLLTGFGVHLVVYDKYPNTEWAAASGAEYVALDELYRRSDVISLHCPLTHETYHLINKYAIQTMKPGVMLINTSRGPLIDTEAVINGLKNRKLGYLGLDVYEEESDLFFEDLSDEVIQDDTFARLQTFPNVLITAHQAFFTREAIANIAATTLRNVADIEHNGSSENEIHDA